MNAEAEKDQGIIHVYAKIIIAFLFVVFLYIICRFLVKNILYDKLHICEPFMMVFLASEESFVNELEQKGQANAQKDQGTAVSLEELYPFKEHSTEQETVFDERPAIIISAEQKAANYLNKAMSVNNLLKEYSSDYLWNYSGIVTLATDLERLTGWNLYTAKDEDEVIVLNNGYLSNPEMKKTDAEIEAMADSIGALSDFSSENDIPLVFVNLGSKICKSDPQLSPIDHDHSNENGDLLLEALNERGIDTLDMRPLLLQSGRDWYSSYYITDHHWTNDTQIWAASEIARLLNEKYGFLLDMDRLSPEAYEKTRYEDCFLGSTGRALTTAKVSLEDYELILPKYATDYSLRPLGSTQTETGDYERVMFDGEAFEHYLKTNEFEKLNTKDPYHCCNLMNKNIEIINNIADNNIKISLIIDSFSAYLVSYLASCVAETETIYMPHFLGSVYTYLETEKPDVMLILYSQRIISDPNENNHFFDFS